MSSSPDMFCKCGLSIFLICPFTYLS